VRLSRRMPDLGGSPRSGRSSALTHASLHGAVPPLATHAVVERAAQGLENPKTATAAARVYHTATDARFTAGGKFSKVLVPRTAKALHPVLAAGGKTLNVAGWVYSGYEAYEAGKKCASQIK
jgi:hypothetical protein